MKSMLESFDTNTKAGAYFAWCGPAFVVLYSAGMLISGFFPPTDPLSSPQQVVDFYTENRSMIGLGTILMCFGAAFIAPWAVAIAVLMRRSELGAPLMTYAAIGSAFFVAIDASLIPTLWAVLAFRADEISPEIILVLNDIGWFLFLFPWQFGGGVWFIAVGLAIIWDKSADPVYPRWAGWASLWFCAMTFPAGLIVFFKSGPFAYNGLLAFYVPFGVLLLWVIFMTMLTLKGFSKFSSN